MPEDLPPVPAVSGAQFSGIFSSSSSTSYFEYLFIYVIFWPFTSIHTYIFQLLTYYSICGLYPMGWESGPQMNESGSSICSHVLSQEALKSVQHEIWTKQENFEQLGAAKVKFVQWRRYCWGRVYSQSYKTKWCPVPGHFLRSLIGLYSQSFGRVETKISQCCITQHVLFWVGGEFGVSVKSRLFRGSLCVSSLTRDIRAPLWYIPS